MKQLYILGIVLAILLIMLIGLSRLGGSTTNGDDADTQDDQASQEAVAPDTPPIEEEDVREEPLQTNQQDTTMSDTPAAFSENTTIVMKTNKGDITIELYTKEMPVTAGNFLKLAREDFYDGIKFHRIIDGFMLQGGDPLTKDDTMMDRWGTGDPGYKIPDEFGPRHSNARGTLSMANAGPNTGGSQFFVNTVDNVFLDGKHPVFGKVVTGMDVVDAISKVETGARDIPVEPVVIHDIEISQ